MASHFAARHAWDGHRDALRDVVSPATRTVLASKSQPPPQDQSDGHTRACHSDELEPVDRRIVRGHGQ